MKSKSLKNSNRRRKHNSTTLKGPLVKQLTIQQSQMTFMPLHLQQSSSTSSLRFQQQYAGSDVQPQPPSNPADSAALDDGRDFILSQDIFCTPDYITPEAPAIPSCFSSINQENIACPESPVKVKTAQSKKKRFADGGAVPSFVSYDSDQQQMTEMMDVFEADDVQTNHIRHSPKRNGYVSQSAVALRCRVMPPPCVKNPYLKDSSVSDIDPFDSHRAKCAGFNPAFSSGDGLSRYRTDFHEVEKIGNGNFSRVFKVLKRIDGCLYAVKQSTKLLRTDAERQKALMEVQALAALGSHENIVSYYSSWFEDEQLYIQMELCDHSLSITRCGNLLNEAQALQSLHQITKALHFIHERGIAHLDLKPDNIYVKNGIYKLGDFGCATLLDKSLPIEEGDARYMPQEILNENYDYLDKVDIFSLGVTIYELARGSPLPISGPHLLNIREGKLPLLPGRSLQLQNLLKAMMDPDPTKRPSAKELLDHPIFDSLQKCRKN